MNQGEPIQNGISHDVTGTLLAYLGGDMSAKERESFERRLLEDESFSQRIEEARFLLLEAYAEGSLPEPVRDRIAAWVASSPQMSQQVGITRSLLHLSASQPRQRAQHRGLWALAAAACVGVVALYPLLHRSHPSTPAPAPSAARSEPRPAPAATQQMDTILLIAERLRGAAPATPSPETHRIHTDQAVRLQVIVPSGRVGDTCSITVKHRGNNVPAATPSIVQVQGPPQASFVEITLAPHMLESGDYTVDLSMHGDTFHLPFHVAPAE